MDNQGFQGGAEGPWLAWVMFGFTLYAGLTMVTNVPFYSFKDLSIKRSVPFVVIVLIALGIAIINIHVPGALFGLFVAGTMSVVQIWYLYNRRTHRADVERLLAFARAEDPHQK